MTTGFSVDSYSAAAAWAGVTGAYSADYPAANLGNLEEPTKVARVTPAGGVAAFTAVMAAAGAVRIVALVHHDIAAGATLRVRLFTDAGMTVLAHDSGTVAFWPTGSAPDEDFLSVRPYILGAEVTAAAARVDIGGLASPIDIGCCELARFWDFGGISDGIDIGFDPRTPALQLAGGASDGVDQWMPQILNGQVDYMALAIAASEGIDFHKLKGTAYPFVVVDDYANAATWATNCFFARNVDIPALVGAMYRHDTFQFRLVEHRR